LSATSAITDEIRDLMKVEFGPQVFEVEKGMVRKFVEAIGDPNPLWREIAPPTFVAALRVEELWDAIHTVNCPLTRNMLNAGIELEYYRPIRVGDTISATGQLIKCEEKEGKTGKMLFMIREHIYKNQHGEVVVKARNITVRY
jgi:hypothetical protein